MALTVPPAAELVAPCHWRTVDCISDLHLQASEPATFDAFAGYLRTTPADAVCILGDLFEVWIGDDAADEAGSFEAVCVALLREASAHTALYVMHGNRDFLMGGRFHAVTGSVAMNDPTRLALGAHHWLLSHGDALCVDDAPYLAFRAQVRAAAWQHDFLARPLAERRALARDLRDQSEAQKTRSAAAWADVDTAEALAWLEAAAAPALVHGHTHRPSGHMLDDRRRRIVLTDWDLSATPPRGAALRLSTDGSATRIALC